MRLWYLRRAVPWASVVGCGTVAVVLTAAVHRWPETSGVLLPYALVACAAAAGFLMDEQAAAIVRVTARGGPWSLVARWAGFVLPAGLWAVIVVGLPSTATTERSTLLLAGVAGCLLGAGAATLLARVEVTQPGAHLAGAFVGAMTTPFVLGAFFGWDPVVPVHGVAAWVTTFWLGVGVLAACLAVAGLRRTP